jgi:hypothetical protein
VVFQFFVWSRLSGAMILCAFRFCLDEHAIEQPPDEASRDKFPQTMARRPACKGFQRHAAADRLRTTAAAWSHRPEGTRPGLGKKRPWYAKLQTKVRKWGIDTGPGAGGMTFFRPSNRVFQELGAMQMHSYPLLKIQDPSGLSEDDWTELGKLQRAYSLGGNESLSKVLDDLLTSNRMRAAAVIRALSPREVRETIDDELLWELEALAGDEFELQPELAIRVLSPREIREPTDDESVRELEVLAGDACGL